MVEQHGLINLVYVWGGGGGKTQCVCSTGASKPCIAMSLLNTARGLIWAIKPCFFFLFFKTGGQIVFFKRVHVGSGSIVIACG